MIDVWIPAAQFLVGPGRPMLAYGLILVAGAVLGVVLDRRREVDA